jgi:hypothetical protein
MAKRKPKGNGQTRSKARRAKPITQAARSNGHELVVPQCPSRPADTRWLARLQALDCEAESRRIASCERPQELKTLLGEIKSMQEICARLLAEYYEERVKLFRLEVQVRRKLQEHYDGMPTATGPGRGKRITQGGKLSQLHASGTEIKQAYKYRDIVKLQPANIDSYVTTCRAEHRVPTLNGLLSTTRKGQMLERNVRNRPVSDDHGGLFGSSVSEGDPSPAALAHATIRQFCEEDRLAHVAAILADMPECRSDFIKWLIDHRYLQDFVQGFYERRGRPDEQRRFVAELMAENEPESDARTNSSDRDETEIGANAVAIPVDTTDAATVN